MKPEHDTTSFVGAQRLANNIRYYWTIRGYDVAIRFEEMDGSRRQAGMINIRSDMINGMPVTKLKV